MIGIKDLITFPSALDKLSSMFSLKNSFGNNSNGLEVESYEAPATVPHYNPMLGLALLFSNQSVGLRTPKVFGVTVNNMNPYENPSYYMRGRNLKKGAMGTAIGDYEYLKQKQIHMAAAVMAPKGFATT
jgi:hypothetical protein